MGLDRKDKLGRKVAKAEDVGEGVGNFVVGALDATDKIKEYEEDLSEKKWEIEQEIERLKEEESCQKKNIMSYLILQWIYFWSNEETLLGKLKGRKAERWLRELEKEETNDSPNVLV